MFSVGKLNLEKPIMLAPMEDVTDISYRILCRELGADVVFTEFVNSDGLIRDCKKAEKKMKFLEGERPVGIQIYGQHIDSMVEAAKEAEAHQPELIDINAGCWVKKVAGRGAGAGLLKDPDFFEEMVKSVVDAVKLPVTVKTRLGWDMDSISILENAKRIEGAGAKGLTLHCRTRSQGHSGEADWSWIEKVKRVVSIPVTVNGNVLEPEDVLRAFQTTPADGVMIARGAIGRPWIFQEARELMETGTYRVLPLRKKVEICLRHLTLHVAHKGDRAGFTSFRKYYAGYLKGYPNAGKTRVELMAFMDYGQIAEKLFRFVDEIENRQEVSSTDVLATPNLQAM
jgi:tRNA-dihydrouridine synthase B